MLSTHLALLQNHPFTYENMLDNRSNIPTCLIKGVEYESIFNGGWMRIRTRKGVEYHLAQARLYHLTPDWKIHFSICANDMSKAWNIIGNLFLEKNCNMSMKMKVADYDNDAWPIHMHGREITVYIYQHESIYTLLSQKLLSPADQLPRQYWLDFISEAEKRLKLENIVSRGIAEGDFPLGTYSSLRNESFVEIKPEWKNVSNTCELDEIKYCYPPNEAGFNAVQDTNPLKKQSCCLFFSKKPTRLHHEVLNKHINENILPLEIISHSQSNTLKTIHIKSPPSEEKLSMKKANAAQKELMKLLYEKFLKEDPLFHFFYEPDIIIRTSLNEVCKKIQNYLNENNLDFLVYAYPTPHKASGHRYGESTGGIVEGHLDLFLPIFHAHSVAALSLSDDEHIIYMERTIHTMFNPKGYTRHEEGEYLAMLSSMKTDHSIISESKNNKEDSKKAFETTEADHIKPAFYRANSRS